MSEAIITFFACLMIYRAACRLLDWHPLPLVQVIFNNHNETELEK
jgi:hypothetical protein